MPNWVRTILTIEASEARADEILTAIEAFDEEQNVKVRGTIDFNKIIPTPSDVYQGNLGQEEGKKYPGEKNWYTFNTRNWGTKWNASCDYGYDCGRLDEFTIMFDTAWSVAEPVMCKLSEMYPDVTVKVKYADEDIGSNCGEFHYKNGTLIHGMDGDRNFALEVWGYEDDPWIDDESQTTGPNASENAMREATAKNAEFVP